MFSYAQMPAGDKVWGLCRYRYRQLKDFCSGQVNIVRCHLYRILTLAGLAVVEAERVRVSGADRLSEYLRAFRRGKD